MFIMDDSHTLDFSGANLASHSIQSAMQGAIKSGVGSVSQSAEQSFDKIDWSPLADVIKKAFSDFSNSAVQAEKDAAAAANAFSEKMWNKTAQYNSEAVDKANAFTEYLQRLQFDLDQQKLQNYYPNLVESLRKAHLNPALGINGLSGSSSLSSGGSGQAASMSSSAGSKANTSSAYGVQQRLIGTVLDTAISLLIARETNATKEEQAGINGIFNLLGRALSALAFL